VAAAWSGEKKRRHGEHVSAEKPMIFKQFYLESLGHASYLVGSEQTGDALVFDVRRDVDLYFAEARRQGLRLRYAADSHQHNDYLTGICELPARAEVHLLAGARAEPGYEVPPMAGGGRLGRGYGGVAARQGG